MPLRPCLTCEAPSSESYCVACRALAIRKPSNPAYNDPKWKRLSKRARRLSPFCALCGSPDDLTLDHSLEAWAFHKRGRAVPLSLVRVLCRSCNSRQGKAQSVKTWGGHPL